ncbi:hypothetical protein AVEN_205470-1 [Araneus ventricosus]|uniref:Uncharacterized protein n=1 Tax=Araneus ventricosus TaxID=182803 RepID=A0A4Y2CDI7_ARAVE|nr:hypothetical protein AVEN_205470-1 [Araneus ventricosus]
MKLLISQATDSDPRQMISQISATLSSTPVRLFLQEIPTVVRQLMNSTCSLSMPPGSFKVFLSAHSSSYCTFFSPRLLKRLVHHRAKVRPDVRCNLFHIGSTMESVLQNQSKALEPPESW